MFFHLKWICVLSIQFTLLNLTCWADDKVWAPIFEVGWQWEYQHSGPSPGSIEPAPIDGNRVRLVKSLIEEENGKHWVIEERFTNRSDKAAHLYVNEERLLTAVDFKNNDGEIVKLNYNPPIPYQITKMNIGEKKIFESKIQVALTEFSLPTTIVFKRLEDETITTPAGEFTGCQHYKITSSSIIDIKIAKIPVSETREVWYHSNVNGVLKEVYRKSPIKFMTWSKEGYTAISILTTFRKDVAIEVYSPVKNVTSEKRQQLVNRTDSRPNAFVAFLVMIIILAATGFYVIAKRIKKWNADHPHKNIL